MAASKSSQNKRHLVIVESPTKARTIRKFLGSRYEVIASEGHVVDLPKSRMGVDIEHDFEPQYITIRGKGELLSSLKNEAKKADKVYLATDPDREGEAISWHLANTLGVEDSKVSRVTFNEITKDAVKNAMKAPRKIDMGLVDAQQARRVLDRLVGYQISPILWKKVKKGLSAGRVQSACLRLLSDREKEIADFTAKEYWTVDVAFQPEGSRRAITCRLTKLNHEKLEITSQEEALKIEAGLKAAGGFTVTEVKKGKRTRKSPDAFTTSALQQEASRRLNFSPQKTMSVAQQLYEGIDLPERGTVGLITYLRTDSTRIAEEMQQVAEEYITESYGKEYVGGQTKQKKTGRIQDAHEAIRPTDLTVVPKEFEKALTRDQFKLYQLIYNRFLGSRMAPCEYETEHVTVENSSSGDIYTLELSGSKLVFPGFLKVYRDEDEEEPEEIKESLEQGSKLGLESIDKKQHFTQPPARYTEGLLVRAMEENGVGRPSTYAPTITTLVGRGYVAKEKKLLYVTDLGEIVRDIMAQYFPSIDDPAFTASMENELDQVEEGEREWKSVVREFYDDFGPQLEKAQTELEKVKIEDEPTDVICDKCGRNMVLKNGRYGKFYACPGFPECRNTKPYLEYVDADCPKCGGRVLIRRSKKGRTYYGCENFPTCDFMSWDRPTRAVCPNCGKPLYLRQGRRTRLLCQTEGCGYQHELTEQEAESYGIE